jgi:SAM-dependent methyltransferase
MTSTEYYNDTASAYDQLHNYEPEHTRAFEIGWPLIHSDVRSVLDVGCGTGRGLSWLANREAVLDLHGVDPAEAMIEIARRRLHNADLRVAFGENLPFQDQSIDVVTAAAIMHHVDDPQRVISEMFRVARKAILISDHNNYAFGSNLSRRIRVVLKALNLFDAATYVKQGFNKRGWSQEDGWWYPYSLLDNYGDIAPRCSQIFLFPTRPAFAKGNILFSQSHFGIVGLL